MKAVNLIPSEHRPVAKTTAVSAAGPPSDRPVGAYAILGVLAFAVVAMALMVFANNDIKKSRTELAQVEQDTQAISSRASTLQSFADFKQLADSRKATVAALADARFPWAQTLDDVSRALPADVFISSFDGATSGSGTGGGSSLRSAITAPSIELNGCTKSQSSVARLMSRLRDVRGVTRVTLTKSATADETTSPVAPAPATGLDGSVPTTTSEPCPAGAPPTFDMIIFFERAQASAAAAPNGTAAVSGPTGAAGAITGPTGTTGATTPASQTTAATP